jgi:hypothetical protein
MGPVLGKSYRWIMLRGFLSRTRANWLGTVLRGIGIAPSVSIYENPLNSCGLTNTCRLVELGVIKSVLLVCFSVVGLLIFCLVPFFTPYLVGGILSLILVNWLGVISFCLSIVKGAHSFSKDSSM